MYKMADLCCYCGKVLTIYIGYINRAKKLGVPIYCDRKCAGLGRRSTETPQEKKEHKQWYDLFIRVSMTDREKAADKKRRQEYFKKEYTAKPEKYKKIRQQRMKAHIEYCRQPKYKSYKKKYDQKYRAKKNYGKYWEAFIALRDLQGVVDNRQAKKDQKNITKQQKRKRNAKKHIERQELEKCSMGLHQPG